MQVQLSKDKDGNIIEEFVDFTLPEKTAQEIAIEYEAELTSKIQEHLDTAAKADGWDDMKSARSAAGIPLDGTENNIELSMHARAVVLGRWYLKVWAYAYQVKTDVIAQSRPQPTVDELIAELPVLVLP